MASRNPRPNPRATALSGDLHGFTDPLPLPPPATTVRPGLPIGNHEAAFRAKKPPSGPK
jgi:hypothetical protein